MVDMGIGTCFFVLAMVAMVAYLVGRAVKNEALGYNGATPWKRYTECKDCNVVYPQYGLNPSVYNCKHCGNRTTFAMCRHVDGKLETKDRIRNKERCKKQRRHTNQDTIQDRRISRGVCDMQGYLVFTSFNSGEHTNFFCHTVEDAIETIRNAFYGGDVDPTDEMFDMWEARIRNLEEVHDNTWIEAPDTTWFTVTKTEIKTKEEDAD